MPQLPMPICSNMALYAKIGLLCRLFDLEKRQRYLEDLTRKLEDEGEAMQAWQDAFQQSSQQAMSLFMQQKAEMEKHRHGPWSPCWSYWSKPTGEAWICLDTVLAVIRHSNTD